MNNLAEGADYNSTLIIITPFFEKVPFLLQSEVGQSEVGVADLPHIQYNYKVTRIWNIKYNDV